MKINKKVFIIIIFVILLIIVTSLIIWNKSRTTITSDLATTGENKETTITSSISTAQSTDNTSINTDTLYTEGYSGNGIKVEVEGNSDSGILVVHNKVNSNGTLTAKPYNPSNTSSSNTTAPYIPEGVQPADTTTLHNQDGTVAQHTSPSSEEINYKKTPNDVTLEIDRSTLTNSGVTLIITDNNKYQYAWGPEFGLQIKENDKWVDMKPITELVFNEIAYILDENNQWKYEINWEKFYGKLGNGTYRISKTIYDNGYIYLYSDEFKIN